VRLSCTSVEVSASPHGGDVPAVRGASTTPGRRREISEVSSNVAARPCKASRVHARGPYSGAEIFVQAIMKP
jgi:hypothetical protein